MLRAIAAQSAAFMGLACASCEVLPTAKFADGSMITGGGTIFAKSQSKTVSITHPNGLSMKYATKGHDETVIAGKYLNLKGLEVAADGLASLTRTKESTTRVLAKEETKKAGIQSAERVESLKILNPVEEAAPAIIAPIQP